MNFPNPFPQIPTLNCDKIIKNDIISLAPERMQLRARSARSDPFQIRNFGEQASKTIERRCFQQVMDKMP